MQKVLLIVALIFSANLMAQQDKIRPLMTQLTNYIEEVNGLSGDDAKKEEYDKSLLRLELAVQDLEAFEPNMEQDQRKIFYDAKRMLYVDWCKNNPPAYDPAELKAALVIYIGGGGWASSLELEELVKRVIDQMSGRYELNMNSTPSEIVMLAKVFPYMIERLHNNKTVTWEQKIIEAVWVQSLVFENLRMVSGSGLEIDAIVQSSQQLYKMIGLVDAGTNRSLRRDKEKYSAEVDKALKEFTAIKEGIRK